MIHGRNVVLRETALQVAGAAPERRDPLRALWLEVLRAGIADAFRCELGEGNVGASGWLGSRDFHIVASLAGLDGAALMARLSKLLASPEQVRAALAELVPRGARHH
ncbi:hypothetical protein ACXN5S_19340 [Pseudoroseicyclus sp. H15]